MRRVRIREKKIVPEVPTIYSTSNNSAVSGKCNTQTEAVGIFVCDFKIKSLSNRYK